MISLTLVILESKHTIFNSESKWPGWGLGWPHVSPFVSANFWTSLRVFSSCLGHAVTHSATDLIFRFIKSRLHGSKKNTYLKHGEEYRDVISQEHILVHGLIWLSLKAKNIYSILYSFTNFIKDEQIFHKSNHRFSF